MLYGPEKSDHTSLNLSKQACPDKRIEQQGSKDQALLNASRIHAQWAKTQKKM